MALKKEASDVHLKAGVAPVIRKWGRLRPLSSKAPVLRGHDIDEMAFALLDEGQKEQFRRDKQIDLGWGISGLGRFRIHIFRQRGTTRIVIRNIPFDVPQLTDLNLPDVMSKVAQYERGLVLVTGATGSGKSTTLAALIDHMNQHQNKHIITVEDPIEYLIRDRKSIISQREVGTDATDFRTSLRAALRQDPDVILIGEMRDRETIEIALTAAETGHLVLSTLHTADATETINRILAVFPAHQHAQIRYQLAAVLRGVFSQRLVPEIHGQGFLPAVEVLVNNARVAELIQAPERTSELLQVIEESHGNWGMQTFDQSLLQLVKSQKVSYEAALELATQREDFSLRFSGISAEKDQKKWTTPEDTEKTTLDECQSWHHIQDLDLETRQFSPQKDNNIEVKPGKPSSNKIHLASRRIKKIK